MLSCKKLLLSAAFAALSIGCGPSEVQIDPRSVADVQVRPASGQALFCPGDPFQVEVVAKLKDGSSCSNVDGKRGCLGEKDAVIDEGQIRIEASPGAWENDSFVFKAPADPLASASTGVSLSAWIQSKEGQRSPKGDRLLAPVYDCQRERVFALRQLGQNGENGAAGPDLRVSVTSLSTPWFPNAALIRVLVGNEPVFLISPSADRPVHIVTRGQDGAMGPAGAPGQDGAAGADATADCGRGGDGQPGTDGGPGGKGGDGGPGGRITLELDDAKAEELRSRVIVESLGGAAGPPGPGGPGGAGGRAGAGGWTRPSCADQDLTGKAGAPGKDGVAGTAGQPGAPGPAPEITPLARTAMFGGELEIIRKIEATPRAQR
jgi:hypothetical protein